MITAIISVFRRAEQVPASYAHPTIQERGILFSFRSCFPSTQLVMSFRVFFFYRSIVCRTYTRAGSQRKDPHIMRRASRKEFNENVIAGVALGLEEVSDFMASERPFSAVRVCLDGFVVCHPRGRHGRLKNLENELYDAKYPARCQ